MVREANPDSKAIQQNTEIEAEVKKAVTTKEKKKIQITKSIYLEKYETWEIVREFRHERKTLEWKNLMINCIFFCCCCLQPRSLRNKTNFFSKEQ